MKKEKRYDLSKFINLSTRASSIDMYYKKIYCKTENKNSLSLSRN